MYAHYSCRDANVILIVWRIRSQARKEEQIRSVRTRNKQGGKEINARCCGYSILCFQTDRSLVLIIHVRTYNKYLWVLNVDVVLLAFLLAHCVLVIIVVMVAVCTLCMHEFIYVPCSEYRSKKNVFEFVFVTVVVRDVVVAGFVPDNLSARVNVCLFCSVCLSWSAF